MLGFFVVLFFVVFFCGGGGCFSFSSVWKICKNAGSSFRKKSGPCNLCLGQTSDLEYAMSLVQDSQRNSCTLLKSLKRCISFLEGKKDILNKIEDLY